MKTGRESLICIFVTSGIILHAHTAFSNLRSRLGKFIFVCSGLKISRMAVFTLNMMISLSHLLLSCNCSVNILIYCSKVRQQQEFELI